MFLAFLCDRLLLLLYVGYCVVFSSLLYSPPFSQFPACACFPCPVSRQKVVNHHIKCLHAYNEIKDIAQGLFGKLAEIRGLRTRDVYEDFDVELQD